MLRVFEVFGLFVASGALLTRNAHSEDYSQRLRAVPFREVTNHGTDLILHTFWKGQWNTFNDLSINSALATQPISVRVILWRLVSDGKVCEGNAAAQPAFCCQERFEERLITSLSDEAIGTPFHTVTGNISKMNMLFQRGISQAFGTPWSTSAILSDYLRLALLHKHGGIWFDTDMLFIKDVTPLTEDCDGFVYPWGDNPSILNNAFLFLRKGSPVQVDMIQRAALEGTASPYFRSSLSALQLERKHPDLKILSIDNVDRSWQHGCKLPTCCPRSSRSTDRECFFGTNVTLTDHMMTLLADESTYAYHWHSSTQPKVLPATSAYARYKDMVAAAVPMCKQM